MEVLENESIPTKTYLSISIEENPQRLYARQYLFITEDIVRSA